jgi:hypothetical protein
MIHVAYPVCSDVYSVCMYIIKLLLIDGCAFVMFLCSVKVFTNMMPR